MSVQRLKNMLMDLFIYKARKVIPGISSFVFFSNFHTPREIFQNHYSLSDFIDKNLLEEQWSNESFSKYDMTLEVDSLRNENTKTFKNSDSSLTAHIGSGPVHYIENVVWSKNTFSRFLCNYF